MPKQSVATFFDSYAGKFNAIYGNENTAWNRFVNKHLRKSMGMRFDKTIENCQPIEGKTVIDVGCGPGHYGITLAERGAAEVYGVDFAPSMIDLARQHARDAGVERVCRFAVRDFVNDTPTEQKFDYSIVMGFMDYIEDPRALIDKVMLVTRGKAFFSFPVDSGLLAWQRKLRYRSRCALYLYTPTQLSVLLAGYKHNIEPISRDFLVTVFPA